MGSAPPAEDEQTEIARIAKLERMIAETKAMYGLEMEVASVPASQLEIPKNPTMDDIEWAAANTNSIKNARERDYLYRLATEKKQTERERYLTASRPKISLKPTDKTVYVRDIAKVFGW